MQRDMALVRRLLLEIEAHPHGFVNAGVTVEGYSDDQIGYQLRLMVDEGLIEGRDATCLSDRSPRVLVQRMTWKGHDFLDAVRSPEIWRSVQGSLNKVGGATFEIVKQLATELIKAQLGLALLAK